MIESHRFPLFRNPVLLLLLGIQVLALVACQSQPIDPRDYENRETPLAKIFVRDPSLARAIRFQPPVVVRDEDGFITKVEVAAYAEAANTLKVDFRPVFFNQERAVLTPQPTWQTRFVEPRVPERFILIPNSKDAVDYELHLRWSH